METSKFKKFKIGLFDSGIGGFSILTKLISNYPDIEYFYYSDDANAPYGPKSDDFILNRSRLITEELLSKDVDLIVVACNTATAVSIDKLREEFNGVQFVGVEPFLNAYNKLNEEVKKMVVMTTESTGRSERFKRLKERLDPSGNITHISFLNLARLIEEFYFKKIERDLFLSGVATELSVLQGKNFTHAILGCTHYPLIDKLIENELKIKTLSPCEYVAKRVFDLLAVKKSEKVIDSNYLFNFYSSRTKNWGLKKFNECFLNL
jgi:glutamate racemase